MNDTIHRTLLIRIGAFILAVNSALCPFVLAQQQDSTIATRSIRGSDPLKVTSQVTRETSGGISRVNIKIDDIRGKSPADRNLVVVFYVKSYEIPDAWSYARSVQLAEGTSSVETSIVFHAPSASQIYWDVGVFEDGVDIEQKRRLKRNEVDFQWAYNDGTRTYIGALRSSEETPGEVQAESQPLFSSLTEQINQQRNSISAGRGYGVNTPAVLSPYVNVYSLSEIDADWRYFYSYPFWSMSAQALQECNDRFPDLATALETYIAAGGTLFVHSAPQQNLQKQVDLLLGRMSKIEGRWQTQKSPKQAWWYQKNRLQSGSSKKSSSADEDAKDSPNEDGKFSGLGVDAMVAAETWFSWKYGATQSTALNILDYWGPEDTYSAASTTLEDTREYLAAAAMKDQLLETKHLLGRVLVSAEPPRKVSSELLDRVDLFYGQSTSELTSNSSDGNWFWRNLIEAVGKPPVWTFAVMVALFGGILGPGLLLLTGRIGRRSLMILFVPSVAMLATLAIILYGVLHEGFDTHVRVTSTTFIDADTSSGFAWSRQNYFSGLPPREGLVMSRNTFARPVHSDEETNRLSNPDPRSGSACRVSLSETQRWQGWLKARQQQQLLIGHPIETPPRPITLSARPDGALRVTNATAQSLPIVVIRGGGDDYYLATHLPPERHIDLAPQIKEDVGARLAKSFLDYRPAVPFELQQRGGSLLDFGQRYRYQSSKSTPGTDVINSILLLYFSDKLQIPNYHYATMIESNPSIEIPLDGIEGDSLHIVVGEQRW